MKSGDHDGQSEPRHGSWHVHAICPLTPWPLSRQLHDAVGRQSEREDNFMVLIGE